MAFGFTPKFEQDLDLNDLDPKHYLVIALDAAKQLGWSINYTSRSGFIAFVGGGLFTSMEEFRVIIQDGKAFISSKNAGSGMYDWGKNKGHVEEFITMFERVQSSLTEQQIDEKMAEMAHDFNPGEQDKLALPPPTAADNLKSFFSLFVPRKGFFITPILVDINILVFIMMLISGANFMLPDNRYLLGWGGNLRALTLEGQWWRLITCTFVHAGIFHLLLNMYALVYIGILLEPYLGKLRFAVAYFLTGIAASITSIYWHDYTISVGASGAIFGMYGVFFSLLTTNLIDRKVRTHMLVSIGIFVALNLMNGMKDGIDNAAHMGGVISGFIMGFIFYPSLRKPAEVSLKYATAAGLVVVTLVTSYLFAKQIPDDIAKYDVFMQTFERNEASALELFKLPQNTPKDEILAVIKEKDIYWDKNLKLLDKADELNLPIELVERNYKLRQYCKLRIKSYQFIYDGTNGGGIENYKDSIQACAQKIDTLVNDIKGQQP